MKYLLFLAALFCTQSAFCLDWMNPPLLIPPSPADVVHIENIPSNSPHFFPYFTEQRMLPLEKDELLLFLKSGILSKNDAQTTSTLADIAPFSLPANFDKSNFVNFEDWAKVNKGHYATFLVCAGAFSSKDGSIFFWRKLNDRVLYLTTQKASCYLVLPLKHEKD